MNFAEAGVAVASRASASIKRLIDLVCAATLLVLTAPVLVVAICAILATMGAPVLFLGLSVPEHGYHAPNEFFDWEQAQGGVAAFAHFFEQLSSEEIRGNLLNAADVFLR